VLESSRAAAVASRSGDGRIFYSHGPDPDTPLEETLAALEHLVRQGKALYVGVSNYRGVQFAEAVRVAERLGLSPITITQPRYNLLDRAASAGSPIR
jgi:L-glyceraldehyde 3-phosphate reductase